jgi:hypothetical protein
MGIDSNAGPAPVVCAGFPASVQNQSELQVSLQERIPSPSKSFIDTQRVLSGVRGHKVLFCLVASFSPGPSFEIKCRVLSLIQHEDVPVPPIWQFEQASGSAQLFRMPETIALVSAGRSASFHAP